MSGNDEIPGRVRNLAVERLALGVAPDDLDPKAGLAEVYGVDSVRLFDLIVGLEDDFGVSFPDNELKLANFATVEAIVERLRAKLG